MALGCGLHTKGQKAIRKYRAEITKNLSLCAKPKKYDNKCIVCDKPTKRIGNTDRFNQTCGKHCRLEVTRRNKLKCERAQQAAGIENKRIKIVEDYEPDKIPVH